MAFERAVFEGALQPLFPRLEEDLAPLVVEVDALRGFGEVVGAYLGL